MKKSKKEKRKGRFVIMNVIAIRRCPICKYTTLDEMVSCPKCLRLRE